MWNVVLCVGMLFGICFTGWASEWILSVLRLDSIYFFVALKIHSHLVWFKLFCCRFLFGECLFCVSELRYLDFFFGFRPKLAYLTMFYVYFSQFYFIFLVYMLNLGDNEQILNQKPKSNDVSASVSRSRIRCDVFCCYLLWVYEIGFLCVFL